MFILSDALPFPQRQNSYWLDLRRERLEAVSNRVHAAASKKPKKKKKKTLVEQALSMMSKEQLAAALGSDLLFTERKTKDGIQENTIQGDGSSM